MQTSKFAFTAKLASLTAALALCGGAYAATGTVPGASAGAAQETAATASEPAKHVHKKGQRDHKRGQYGEHRAAMWVPGYGPLNKEVVDALALNDSQIKLVDAAKAEQKAGRAERRDAMKSARSAKLEQIKGGKIDPQAALKQRDAAQQSALAERRKVDEKWLAVWDALDDAQQQKVVAHLNERAEKFAKHAEQRKQHRTQAQPEKASS